MLEITSRGQPQEPKERCEEYKYHLHMFKKSSGKKVGCGWEYFLYIGVGSEYTYPSTIGREGDDKTLSYKFIGQAYVSIRFSPFPKGPKAIFINSLCKVMVM